MPDFDYTSRRWRRMRRAVLARDGYRCRICRRYGRVSAAVTVHHIKPVAEFPDLAFNPDNLIAICYRCHAAAHPEKGGAHPPS